MASTYTLAEMRADVQIAIAPEGDSSLTNAFYNQRINDAIQEIATALELPEMEAKDTSILLQTSVRTYNMTFDPLVVMSVKNVTSDRTLDLATREEADEWDETATGEPTQWFRYGTSLELGPDLPSSDHQGDQLRVRYIKKPTELSADSDTSPLPSYMDRAIREYAISTCHADLNEPKMSRERFIIFRAIMKERKRIRGRELRYANRHLGVGWRH